MKKIVLLGCNDKTRAIIPFLCKDASIAQEICIASRDKAKCDELRKQYQNNIVRISTARVDLSNESGTRMMLTIAQPDMLVNLTEASFSPIIMKLCLEIGVPYVDGALFDIGSGDFLSKQFEFFGDFRQKNLTAVVGCDFNPAGITTIIRDALEEDFDSIESADIIEAGPKTAVKSMNIKELVEFKEEAAKGSKAVYIEGGSKVEAEPLSVKAVTTLPGFPEQEYYCVDNAIVEDFSKELPDIPNVKYFTTYSKPDTSILDELSKFNLLSKTPIQVGDVSVAPLDFISKLLENYELPKAKDEGEVPNDGNSSLGLILSGKKNGNSKITMLYIKNTAKCNAYSLVSAIKAVSKGKWNRAGVFTPCAFEPSIMLDSMRKMGLSYDRIEVAPLDVIKEDK